MIIVSEPDVWMVNLIGRRAQHMVDGGPTFVTHHNILEREAPAEFASLEFGKELDFFRTRHATLLEPQSLDGHRCTACEFKHANHRLVLFSRTDTHKPFHLDVFREGQAFFSIRYLSYQTDLAFDPALFTPPKDVIITEAKPKETK